MCARNSIAVGAWGHSAMDIEAHWITLISIIIGLALTEMLNNLHGLIRDRTHVRWDPLPLVWAATSLFLVLNYWWAAYTAVMLLIRLLTQVVR